LAIRRKGEEGVYRGELELRERKEKDKDRERKKKVDRESGKRGSGGEE
jgi:hypothetical protein